MPEKHTTTDPPQLDEAALMRAAQQDPAAFAPLYELYYPRIYRYCARRVAGAQAAEDVAHTIFTRALQGMGSYRGGNVGAWLFRIAYTTVTDHYRHRRPNISIEAHDVDFPANDAATDTQLIRQEQHSALQRALDQLSPDQRDLLDLKLGGNLTSSQIGEIVGKTAGAVRVEIHRIIQQLRVLYRQEELS